MKGVYVVYLGFVQSQEIKSFIPLAGSTKEIDSKLPELTFDLGDTLYDRLVRNGNSNDGNSISLYKYL